MQENKQVEKQEQKKEEKQEEKQIENKEEKKENKQVEKQEQKKEEKQEDEEEKGDVKYFLIKKNGVGSITAKHQGKSINCTDYKVVFCSEYFIEKNPFLKRYFNINVANQADFSAKNPVVLSLERGAGSFSFSLRKAKYSSNVINGYVLLDEKEYKNDDNAILRRRTNIVAQGKNVLILV